MSTPVRRADSSPRQAVSWDDVFDAALKHADIVAVTRTVTDHLQRTPTRSELHAAHRAAHSYAAGSNVQLLRVPPGTGGRILLLARADADLDAERLRDIAAGRDAPQRRRGRGPRDEPHRAENILREAGRAARWARQLDVTQLDPDHAAAVDRDLADALADLRRLRQRLAARSRQL